MKTSLGVFSIRNGPLYTPPSQGGPPKVPKLSAD